MKNLINEKFEGTKKTMTLLELSNILVAEGYADIFDSQIDGECLDLDSMTGSWADIQGNEIIYFDIVKLDEESNHLNTIIKL